MSPHRLLLLLLFLTGSFLSEAQAQVDRRVTRYVAVPILAKALVRLPAHFDSTRAYPLVVGLHGHGGTATRFLSLAKPFNDGGVIYAALEAPYPTGRGFSWNLREPGAEHSRELAVTYVAAALEALRTDYQVSGVYLLGFSQGGLYTYLTGFTHPHLLDGLIAFGSGFAPEWITEAQWQAAQHLPVFIAHGQQDLAVPLARGEAARDALRARDFDVTYLEFEAGHTVPLTLIPVILEWMGVD